MFIGREKELNFLEERYRHTEGELIVLYGRRRVGKTETLRQFCKGKPHMFFSCRECTDKLQLKNFSEKMFNLNYSSWSKKNLSNHIITYFKKFFRFHLKSEARV